MKLQDDGWEPVTPLGGDGEHTWRVWCDTRRPPTADDMGWPQDGEFLSMFLEVQDAAGNISGGGTSFMGRQEQKVCRQTFSGRDHPTIVWTSFTEDLHGITIETTQRRLDIDAADIDVHHGLRFYAMPLQDGETLTAISPR